VVGAGGENAGGPEDERELSEDGAFVVSSHGENPGQ
jgi:hypothetical protein